jgi:membrane protease YdiL (CAAX protease family)
MWSVLGMEIFDFLKGTIPSPSRSTSAGAVVILLAVTVLSIAMVLPVGIGKPTIAVFAILTLIAIASRSVYAIHLSLFFLLWISLSVIFPALKIWPFRVLVPLVTYGAIVSITPTLRRSVTWLHIGHSGRYVRLLALLTIIFSSVALVIWYFAAQPDLRHHLALVPGMPLWVFPLLALGFALTNAAMEEIIFRGIMMEALDNALGAGHLSNVIQAFSFGALHYQSGFPNGVCGSVTVFVYGLMLGILRRQSRGILAPWMTHIAADITIFMILAGIYIDREIIQ